ncbi:group 1 truncated hemoglobin [Salinigranum rubrum]|uniref:Group 1 truncated hemoglobin n=1 Tax=Salinigranum rubrum TaxID=755307 RepID=A0A2I8VHT4_9EURY|nr:group 1 truncated hemoglobin [Salinigranum rubrum]AUV81470.1 group 1 truncated hemoglobin [Salinigranum rubrum]
MGSDEPTRDDETEPLYDRLGGRDGIAAVVETFYDRVLADERLHDYFEGMEMDDLRAHQTAFLSAVAGGPEDYSGREMRAAHATLNLDESDFDAVAGHLDEALAAHGVSDADRAAVLREVTSLKPAVLNR